MSRLICHPGIKFPDDAATAKVDSFSIVHDVAPSGYIATQEVARLLSCSASSARKTMDRHGVKKALVRRHHGIALRFYKKSHVMDVLKGMSPVVDEKPRGYVDIKEASRILGCSRSCVQRMEKKGAIRRKKVRVDSVRGVRLFVFYKKSDLLSLVKERRAV